MQIIISLAGYFKTHENCISYYFIFILKEVYTVIYFVYCGDFYIVGTDI